MSSRSTAATASTMVMTSLDATSRNPAVIFRLLRYSDRQAILKGARKGHPIKHGQATLYFFPDYSPPTAAKRREFTPVNDWVHK